MIDANSDGLLAKYKAARRPISSKSTDEKDGDEEDEDEEEDDGGVEERGVRIDGGVEESDDARVWPDEVVDVEVEDEEEEDDAGGGREANDDGRRVLVSLDVILR
jgi:hypothetical protein